jgi:hypothetical protein
VKRWAAVACLWLTFGLVFGVGNRVPADAATDPPAASNFPEQPPDDLPNGKVPGEKVPGDDTTTTTSTTVPVGDDTTTTVPVGEDTTTTSTTSTTTTTVAPSGGGGGATPPGGDVPGDEVPDADAPGQDVAPSAPVVPSVSFATGTPVATETATPLEVVAIAFRDVVEELRLNLLPAALLGMFTAVLLLRPLEPKSRRTEGSVEG